MLLLDRKVGTSVLITTASGEKIKVSVISHHDKHGTKLGFDAAKNIKILREEVEDRDKLKQERNNEKDEKN